MLATKPACRTSTYPNLLVPLRPGQVIKGRLHLPSNVYKIEYTYYYLKTYPRGRMPGRKQSKLLPRVPFADV